MPTTITPASGVGVSLLQLGPGATGYGAIDWRRMLGATELQEGTLSAGGMKVTVGSGMSVVIAASTGIGTIIQGDSIAAQGLYYVAPHTATITETITAAHATLARVDQIILEVLDASHDGGASNTVRTRVIDGTATSGATLDNRWGAAALPNSAMRLADLLIPAGSTFTLAANTRDRRPHARGVSRVIERTGGNYTTASTVMAAVDATNLNPRLECSGNPMRIMLDGALSSNTASGWVILRPILDNAAIGSQTDVFSNTNPTAGEIRPVNIGYPWTPAAGSHLFGWQWRVAAGTGTLYAAPAGPLVMMVEEIVRPNFDNT